MIPRCGMTLAEASEYLGVSQSTIRRAAGRGELAVARVGGSRRGRLVFRREDLDRFLAQRQQAFEQSRIKDRQNAHSDDVSPCGVGAIDSRVEVSSFRGGDADSFLDQRPKSGKGAKPPPT